MEIRPVFPGTELIALAEYFEAVVRAARDPKHEQLKERAAYNADLCRRAVAAWKDQRMALNVCLDTLRKKENG